MPDTPTTATVAYDRPVLVEVLVYHYRKDIGSCGCGWAELGRSHPEHVADVYEQSVAVRADRQECALRGHSWNVVETVGAGPEAITCSRCGAHHKVAPGVD